LQTVGEWRKMSEESVATFNYTFVHVWSTFATVRLISCLPSNLSRAAEEHLMQFRMAAGSKAAVTRAYPADLAARASLAAAPFRLSSAAKHCWRLAVVVFLLLLSGQFGALAQPPPAPPNHPVPAPPPAPLPQPAPKPPATFDPGAAVPDLCLWHPDLPQCKPVKRGNAHE
jgi:hypothetical protein